LRRSTSSIEIKATATEVWHALTNPEMIKQWQYGSVLETTWEPGTPIRFTAEWNGQRFEQWGRVIEVIPPVSLQYTLFAPRPDLDDRPENYFLMSYRLEEREGKTLLAITQDDPRPPIDPKAQTPEDEAENPVLLALKALVEKT
jgi:uncharacterized protein YndB with AHSA1/START domain